MREFFNPKELIKYRKELKGSIGFVPTMGALHQGHISLIKESVKENRHTIVSIFVNPKQFLEGEDLNSYPRRLEADQKICRLAGVDVLFLPSISDIYKDDELSIKAPDIKSYILEGFSRPKHFDGVLQIVLKLFNITSPTKAYFGKKDAQQLFLIEKMVETLFLDIKIVPCEIIRDEDGLALSSRNIYLSKEERAKALAIPQALKLSSKLIMAKELNSKRIKDQMIKLLEDNNLNVEYVEIVDREFNHIDEIKLKDTIILVCAYVGKTRLIDNIWV